ncbi:MAG: hypothetical protein ACW99J_19230 [Candidatus Thorarchaeota archaeon]|jgi:hypothetical protein
MKIGTVVKVPVWWFTDHDLDVPELPTIGIVIGDETDLGVPVQWAGRTDVCYESTDELIEYTVMEVK